jgi:RNA polymerase sigma-70 factor (ECF subfamily)
MFTTARHRMPSLVAVLAHGARMRFSREPRPVDPGASRARAQVDTSRVDRHPSGNPHAARADRILREVDTEHGQSLLGLALRSGLADAAAEDAVQEALFRLWQEIRKGIDVIEPRAWTFRVLYRIAMDEHRFRRRADDIVARLSTRSWRQVDADIAQRISIWSLVDQLPTRQRQVMYLRFKADMSFDQIAAILGVTASAARAHATFAAKRLRQALGEETLQ